MGSDFQQELDIDGSSVMSLNTSRPSPPRCRHSWWWTDAIRIAAASRKPTVVILPTDVQNMAMEDPALEHWVSRTGVGHASTADHATPRGVTNGPRRFSTGATRSP